MHICRLFSTDAFEGVCVTMKLHNCFTSNSIFGNGLCPSQILYFGCVLFYETIGVNFSMHLFLFLHAARIDHICESFTSHTAAYIFVAQTILTPQWQSDRTFHAKDAGRMQLYPETKFYVASDSRLKKTA
jgi:hypothetical protein